MKETKTVLVVDDETALRDLLHDKLASDDTEVIAAKDGKEAVAIALSKHPNLILLDLLMPEMSGIEVLKKLRADDWGKNAIVIVLTNVGKQEMIAEAVIMDTYEYLIKSDWKLEDIITKVREKLMTIKADQHAQAKVSQRLKV